MWIKHNRISRDFNFNQGEILLYVLRPSILVPADPRHLGAFADRQIQYYDINVPSGYEIQIQTGFQF